jgi:hypothetical protein
MSSLIALRMGMKEIPELLQGRSLHNLCEGTFRNRQYWNINDGIDNLRINLNDMPLNWCLKYDPMVLIMNRLQVPIKLSHQPGIYCACIVVNVSPMVSQIISATKSRGATITSALSTFLSGIACQFSTFAKEAARASSVLCRTLRWELPAEIFLKRSQRNICPKQMPQTVKTC